MRSKASFKGHPLHPMLVALPIGLFVGSLACDLLYTGTGDAFWYAASWYAMAGGIVGALVAAIPGLIDYYYVANRLPRARATATAHLIVNLSVVALYALNLYLRAGYAALVGTRWILALGMTFVAMAALGASGWLGGELVYRLGLSFDRRALRVTMLDEEAAARELERP